MKLPYRDLRWLDVDEIEWYIQENTLDLNPDGELFYAL